MYKCVNYISCEKPISVNVLSQEAFQERAAHVLQIFGDILGKTLGPYGAPTIISDYPYSHITKDGYTVAANTEFSLAKGEPIDRVIASLAREICFRLNHIVGDGTTTAIEAVNKVYDAYCYFGLNRHLRPRNVMNAFEEAKETLVKELETVATPVTEKNMEEVIRKIVHVSSNGDEKITNLITQAYREIGFPSIICEESDTGETYMEMIDGFRCDVVLGDRIYINSDSQIAIHKNVDVLIFDHKVGTMAYQKIIAPLRSYCKKMERHLLCLAPIYDEVTLNNYIRQDVENDFNRENDSPLIIGSFPANTRVQKKTIGDLAMVLGTTIITRVMESEILLALEKEDTYLHDVINITDRGIPGIYNYDNASGTRILSNVNYTNGTAETSLMRVGFADEFMGGMKNSIFHCSQYSNTVYDACLQEAKSDLDEVIHKYAILGTYTREIYDAQVRYSTLKMKMATIRVGGDTELSKQILKDSVEDAIQAAKSSYQYGFVQGCGLSLITLIQKNLALAEDSLMRDVFSILEIGYRGVYERVLRNAFDNNPDYTEMIPLRKAGVYLSTLGIQYDEEDLEAFIQSQYGKVKPGSFRIGKRVMFYDFVIDFSLFCNKVLDLDKMEFSTDIINSSKTDIEILTATIDLLSLLTTGNQVVMPRIDTLRP